MAAHALTIARQILTMSDEDIVKYAEGSLPAPGWDSLPWGSDVYRLFYDAVKRKDAFSIRQLAAQAENESKYLETYGLSTFDRYRTSLREHVRFGKSYFRKRLDAFFAGTLKAVLDTVTPEAVKRVQEIVPEAAINRG